MRILTTTSLLLATCVPLCAQTATNPVGYPNDTVRAGSGNLVPFGFSSSTNFDEGRWQQLIPARVLPSAGGVILGIAVHCQSSNATVTYASLRLTLSHTTATTLTTSFGGNLPTPLVVFSSTNVPIQWSTTSWVPIMFTLPFPYNGKDNLVVEIQKVYDRVTNPVPGIVTHQTTGTPHRTDLDPARYSFSPFGSGGSTTPIATNSSSAVLSLRLLTATQATTTVASLNQPNGGEFGLGSNMSLTTWGAAGTAYGTVLDVAFRTPIAIPGISGLLLINPGFMLTSGTTGNSNSGSLTLQLPTNPAFVSTYWVVQSVTLNPAKTNFAMTNAADLFITQ
jgi:hypothetical protein